MGPTKRYANKGKKTGLSTKVGKQSNMTSTQSQAIDAAQYGRSKALKGTSKSYGPKRKK